MPYSQASKSRRITLAYLAIIITLAFLFISTFTPADPSVFFMFSLTLGAVQAASGAYFLTALVAYAAYFGPMAMQSVMSGQAAVAVVVSIVQLITTLSTLGTKPHQPSNPDDAARTSTAVSASYFYLISILGLVFAYFAYRRLTRMSLFRRTVARFEGSNVIDSATEYEALPEDDPIPPSSQPEDDDEDTDLMAMSTSIGSLREREREINQEAGGGLDASVSSLRGAEVERGPQTMGELEPVVNATFWAVWKVNSMYNIAVMNIYVVTLVGDFSISTSQSNLLCRLFFPQSLLPCNP